MSGRFASLFRKPLEGRPGVVIRMVQVCKGSLRRILTFKREHSTERRANWVFSTTAANFEKNSCNDDRTVLQIFGCAAVDVKSAVDTDFLADIRSAPDAESAIAMAESFPPDIVFLDIRLPDMTGFELLRRLKESDAGSGAKFVGLSGFRAVDTPESVEFDHFLEKPVRREKLDLGGASE